MDTSTTATVDQPLSADELERFRDTYRAKRGFLAVPL